MLSDRGMEGRQWAESGRRLQEMLMREMALNLRPLLYGGCIWVVFGNDRAKKENEWIEQQWANGQDRKGEEGGGRERPEWTAGEGEKSVDGRGSILAFFGTGIDEEGSGGGSTGVQGPMQ